MHKKTPFYDAHIKAQAKMVDFAGWEMPLHYGSQIKEHHQVRQHAGMFDVSHMGIVDVKGKEAFAYLRFLLANDVAKLTPNKALYTCMLNNEGGIIDDLIVYRLAEEYFRLVINAGRREKDWEWLNQEKKAFNVSLIKRDDLVMLALQGPEVKEKIKRFFVNQEKIIENLTPFSFAIIDNCFVARTGYTGEEGVEIIFPAEKAEYYWQAFLSLGIYPCGLAARDTLRLEAGLNLYGHDMDESVTPLESGLAWTVAFDPDDRQFLGKEALLTQRRQGLKNYFVGLILQGPGIMRDHQKILVEGKLAGIVTSGGYSPTLEKSIAFARILRELKNECYVEIRQKPTLAKIVKLPFVRHGKKMHDKHND